MVQSRRAKLGVASLLAFKPTEMLRKISPATEQQTLINSVKKKHKHLAPFTLASNRNFLELHYFLYSKGLQFIKTPVKVIKIPRLQPSIFKGSLYSKKARYQI